MKKTLVLLLSLVVAGMAVSEDIGWSGRLSLGAKVDMVEGWDEYNNSYVTEEPTSQSSFNDFTYKAGNLVLTFGFGFNNDEDENDDTYMWQYIAAKYSTIDYGFSMGFTHHLEGGMDINDPNTVTKFEFWETYGWYNLLNGDLELRVSKKGGEPYWWRAATVALGAFEAWDDGGLYGDGDQFFEANENGGIWLNYIGFRNLSFGVRLRNPFGAVADNEYNNTPGNYLKDMTIGAKYDTGDWGVSFMTNLRSYKAYTQGWGYVPDGILHDAFVADFHVGFNYMIMDGIWVYGDFYANEALDFTKSKATNDNWYMDKPLLSFGLGSSYSGGPFGANLTFMALDLSSAFGATNQWEKEDSMEMNLFLSGSYEAGPFNAGLEINVYDLADNFSTVGQLFTTQDWGGGRSLHINPSAGYQITDKFKANLGLGWTKGLGSDNDKYQLFRVNPAFIWNVAGSASISISYYLEYDTDADNSIDNNIGLYFYWEF
jgi:hypothetical protein